MYPFLVGSKVICTLTFCPTHLCRLLPSLVCMPRVGIVWVPPVWYGIIFPNQPYWKPLYQGSSWRKIFPWQGVCVPRNKEHQYHPSWPLQFLQIHWLVPAGMLLALAEQSDLLLIGRFLHDSPLCNWVKMVVRGWRDCLFRLDVLSHESISNQTLVPGSWPKCFQEHLNVPSWLGFLPGVGSWPCPAHLSSQNIYEWNPVVLGRFH